MKNEFNKNDIGKSIKLEIFDEKTKTYVLFKGVFLGFYLTMNNRPFPETSIYGYFPNNLEQQPKILEITNVKYRNILNARLPKEISETGKRYIKNINDCVKRYNKLRVEGKVYCDRLSAMDGDDVRELVYKYKKKFPELNSVDLANTILKKYLPKLHIVSTLEDYDEYDMEEYGVQDLEETRYLSLNLRSSSYSEWVVDKYLNMPKFQMNKNMINTMKLIYPDFNFICASIISMIIRLCSVNNSGY